MFIKRIIQIIISKCNETFIDSNCEIGKYTYIGKRGGITKAVIGNYCTIGDNVYIGQGEHNYKQVALSGQLYSFNSYEEYTKKECIIGNDVWIGVGAIILRGVTIGNGAVIGANSVVTKDIPPYAVAVGSPARVVKYRFSEEKIKRLLEVKWWEYDIDEAKKIVAKLEEEFKND